MFSSIAHLPKSLLAALICLILITSACASTPITAPASPTATDEPVAPTSSAPIIAVINGTLIDGNGGDPIADGVVLIQETQIIAIGTRASLLVPTGAQVIDAKGGTILPGFINAHVHAGYTASNLEAWARGGVTTVRDEGIQGSTGLKERLAARDAFNQDPKYARLVSAGFMISVPGGYGQLAVTSADDARRRVNEELDAGVENIKVSQEDGYAGTSGLPKLTLEEMKAVVETAHARLIPVSGHITQAAYISIMLDAGVDDIAHLAYDPIPADVIQRMVRQNVTLIPTFTVFRNFNAPVSTCVTNLRAFVQAGGQVALGNDFGGGPGSFELGMPMYEIEKMAEAGMTPMQIILAGTRNAAQVIGIDHEVGTISTGKFADVLIVSGDPLKDWHVLNQIAVVIHNGKVIVSNP